MKGRLGAKARTLRRRKGLTQTEVASRLGISSSYLNLIEHDQRQLPANLLLKLAEILNVELAAFTDDTHSRLAADLQEIFGDPLFEEHPLTTSDVRELAENPAAARAFVDFILSDEGQKLAVAMGYIPAKARVGMPSWLPPGTKITLMPIDIAKVSEGNAANLKRFAALFSN